MKTYRVTWSEIYCCAREVAAESEEAALELVRSEEMDGVASPDQKEFGDYEGWESYEVEG